VTSNIAGKIALVAGLLAAGPAAAADDTPFKLTAGYYLFSSGARGADINLRHTSDLGNVWLGEYRSPQRNEDQWRLGWDRTFGETVRISPSLQAAAQGFFGGSIYVETGDPWFVGGGLGRTNLRPYWNLNFDPNDSWTFSTGYRQPGGAIYSLLLVRDNRQNPDQQHLHFTFRQPLADGQRLTFDLLRKRGLVEDEMIHLWGATLTYDWPRFFLRAAWDPKSNFGPDNLRRFDLGIRF
jgi:hypothetical protein